MAERAWFTPPPLSSRRRAEWEQDLEGTEPFRIEVRGQQLHGWTAGEGPLVLLVHGWGGRAAQMARLGKEIAAAGFRVAAVDSPGHGQAGLARTNVFEMSEALASVVDRFGAPVAVVAHSLGAMVTLHAMEDAMPEGLVLLAPVLDVGEVLDTFSERAQLFPWTARALRRRITSFVYQEWPGSPRGAFADLGFAKTLIVHDPADSDTPFATSAGLAAVSPDTDLHLADGLGHTGVLRDPGIAARVVDFLGGIRPASTSTLASYPNR